MTPRARRLIRFAGPPLGLLALVIAVWQALVVGFSIPKITLPAPTDVWRVCIHDFGPLSAAFVVSARAAVSGYLLSLFFGTLVALVFAQSAAIRRACFPYAIFLQTVPIVAIAPLIVIWFGASFQAVVAIVVIISLFPIVTSATAGLTSVPAGLVDLFRLAGANRWQTLLKLQLPHAVPSLLLGARTSSGLAVVGSIVGEFFAGYGSQGFGLGYRILQSGNQGKTPDLFASILASAMLGIMIFGTVSLLGQFVLRRWYGAQVDPHA